MLSRGAIRAVAAVYDRRHFVDSRTEPALIERRYSCSIRVFPQPATTFVKRHPTTFGGVSEVMFRDSRLQLVVIICRLYGTPS